MMFLRTILFLACMYLGAAVHGDEPSSRQSPVVLDENLWVTFYDLPSRRFRAIRGAILTRNKESAARDLIVTANYLSVEADRTSAVLQAPLQGIVEQLRLMAEAADKVTLEELDALFGRAHWLLAQHYLQLAREARDMRESRNTSLYLLATTHHMERALLWSNVAVTREVHATLEGLRKIASQLQDPDTAERAYREKPIVRAERLLEKISKRIDRNILLPVPAKNGAASGDKPPDS